MTSWSPSGIWQRIAAEGEIHISIFKKAGSIGLAVVLVSGALLALPRPVSRFVATDAVAEIAAPVPTPTIPDLLGEPSPSPSPTPTQEPGGGGGGGGGTGGGGGGTGGGGGGGGTGGSGEKDGSKSGAGNKAGSNANKGGPASKNNGKRKGRGKNPKATAAPDFSNYVPGGTFTTDRLVTTAAHLRSLGMSKEEADRTVYPPFLIAGQAGWTDTWGAPRYGPGPIVRTHEGQDVFCKYGDPVLAPQAGTVSYSEGGLGGITARVHASSSSYWYLTHLSGTNASVFPPGSSVGVGDVVGFCGNSGNAITTPPHVHFGWYVNGRAKDPQGMLERWLRTAERRVTAQVAQVAKKRVKQVDRLTVARRFGDSFAPGMAELRVSGESLWASGSTPVTGAFGLAEAALQAAMSQTPAPDAGLDPDVDVHQLESEHDHDAEDHDTEDVEGRPVQPEGFTEELEGEESD